MALSNILREPRREITETAIGLSLIVLFCLADYYLADIVYSSMMMIDDRHDNFLHVMSFIASALVIIVIIGGFVLAHSMGQSLCDWLQKNNIHLRPKRRI